MKASELITSSISALMGLDLDIHANTLNPVFLERLPAVFVYVNSQQGNNLGNGRPGSSTTHQRNTALTFEVFTTEYERAQGLDICQDIRDTLFSSDAWKEEALEISSWTEDQTYIREAEKPLIATTLVINILTMDRY
jgi:hypothetical protein